MTFAVSVNKSAGDTKARGQQLEKCRIVLQIKQARR
jgi:hypothetical protein